MKRILIYVLVIFSSGKCQLPPKCEHSVSRLRDRQNKDIRLDGVKCLDAGLREVPSDFPSYINCIELLNDVIDNLTAASFSNYANLEYLTIKHSQIDFIADDTFLSLKKLVHIDLSGNNIAALPPLPSSVEVINLNTMKKTHILFESEKTSVSIGNLKSLRRLMLKNNLLRSWPSTLLRDAKSLNEIYLDKNNINLLTINDLANLCNLQIVGFTNNAIAKNEKSICHCRLVEKWSVKNDIKIENLTCPVLPGLDDKKCRSVLPEDYASLDSLYAQCQEARKSWFMKYWFYIAAGVLIALIAFVLYRFCWSRRRPRQFKKTPPDDISSD